MVPYIYVCREQHWETEMSGSPELLDSQFSQNNKLQVLGERLSQNTRWRVIEERKLTSVSGLSWHVHAHVCVCSHTWGFGRWGERKGRDRAGGEGRRVGRREEGRRREEKSWFIKWVMKRSPFQWLPVSCGGYSQEATFLFPSLLCSVCYIEFIDKRN